MIDIDKYKGHTPAPWHEIFMQGDEYNNGYDDLQTLGFNGEAQDLIADAPLLLEEVKRLRAEIAGIDALVLETYKYVQNTVAPFGWESYLMKRFNLIAEHLGLLNNASE